MAEKESKPNEKHPGGDGHGESAGRKAGRMGLLKKTPVLLGGAMVVEAVVLFAAFKMFAGGPDPAEAAILDGHLPASQAHETGGHDVDHATGVYGHGDAKSGHAKGGHATHASDVAADDPKRVVEVLLVEQRGTKRVDGRTYLYQIKLSALTTNARKPLLDDLVTHRSGLLRDRVRTIIAELDVAKLRGDDEPGLDTLRRQVRHRLNDLLGRAAIDEVLVQDCILQRMDF